MRNRTRSRIGFLALLTAISMLFATVRTPEPEVPVLRPAADPAAEIIGAAIIEELGGGLRHEGLFLFTADNSFDTQSLARLSSAMELISEGERNRVGTRLITARVPDSELDGVLERLHRMPGVIAASKSGIAKLDG